MKPSQAIKIECLRCRNGQGRIKCKSQECNLDIKDKSPLRRIKAHCIKCVPDQTIYGVKSCKGRVFNPMINDFDKCALHDYRLGHNPHSKRKPNPIAVEALKNYHRNAIKKGT
jgi:hypothetical protein